MAIKKDLTGERYGKLTVIALVGIDNSGHTSWECQCDCGNTKIVRGSHLKSGNTRSCGCEAINQLIQRSTKHGMEHTRLYRIWQGMMIRCYNPESNRYDRYGGRGITVCDEWKNDIKVFIEWAMKSGYQDNLTIERKDNDGSYSPENCRWVTMKEQMNHTSRSRYITVMGVTKTASQWADETGVNSSTILERIKRGWKPEEAVMKPARKQEKSHGQKR